MEELFQRSAGTGGRNTMSPIFEISLAIIFCLWVIPFTWAVSSSSRFLLGCLKAISSWPVYLRREIARARYYSEQRIEQKELRHLELEIAEVELAYQDLQNKLVKVRGETATSCTAEASLENKVRNLRDRQKQKRLSSKDVEKLPEAESELRSQKAVTEVLRTRLTDLETEIQKAYTRKQVFVAQTKADFATKKAQKLLSRDHWKTLGAAERSLEQSVVKREIEIYGSSALEDRYVSFPRIAQRTAALSIDRLDVDELKVLMEAIELAAAEASLVILSVIPFERVMASEIDRGYEDALNWAKKASEAYPKSFDVHEAEIAKTDKLYSAANARKILEASVMCTNEFKAMHSQLANKEREIFDRILELNSAKVDGADTADDQNSAVLTDCESSE
ncbi:MAG: hypothetical protein C0469_10420 [Cyanobacteria bacterium DS2.3.42]|nr:hypothetical protein [Cyanobacteria bacterium DS2.3.42]